MDNIQIYYIGSESEKYEIEDRDLYVLVDQETPNYWESVWDSSILVDCKPLEPIERDFEMESIWVE